MIGGRDRSYGERCGHPASLTGTNSRNRLRPGPVVLIIGAMTSVTHVRPVSLGGIHLAALSAAAGAAVGITARWLQQAALPPTTVSGLAAVLLGLVGVWMFAAGVIAWRAETLLQAAGRTALFMGAMAATRFLFAARFEGAGDVERLTPWVLLSVLVLPSIAAALWWVGHRGWSASAPVQIVAGMVLALPAALLVREAVWVQEARGDLVGATLVAMLAAGLIGLTTRTLTTLIGVAVAIVPAYWLVDDVWGRYLTLLELLLSPAAPLG